MQIKALDSLTHPEVRELARHAADRGDCFKDANPFPKGSISRGVFDRAYLKRAAHLRTPHATGSEQNTGLAMGGF